MRKRYIQINGELREVCRDYVADPVAPTVWGDLPGYESPATGLWVEGRVARREDLKRSGCRPWEGISAEKAEAAKWQYEQAQRQESALNESAHRAWYALSPSKRRLLENA